MHKQAHFHGIKGRVDLWTLKHKGSEEGRAAGDSSLSMCTSLPSSCTQHQLPAEHITRCVPSESWKDVS